MASKCKTAPKAELIAICRLEFYKKKKNWKFVQDVCKKDVGKDSQEPPPYFEPQPEPTKPPESKPTLDETYNVIVEPEPDVVDGNPDLSMLNDAFMESDFDKIPPTTPWDPAAGGWHGLAVNPGQTWGPSQQAPDLTGLVYGPEAQGQAWQHVEQEWSGEAFYAAQTQDLNDLGLGRGGSWSPACGEGMLEDEWKPGAVLSAAEDYLRLSPHPWRGEDDCRSLSMDSASEFIRGAAAAPHSSEIELSLPDAASEPALEGVSAQQLAARVGLHAAALRRLLREAGRRAQHPAVSARRGLRSSSEPALRRLLREAGRRAQHPARPRTSLSLDYPTPPYDLSCEFPTRDFGTNQTSNAYLLTGSYTDLTGGLGDPFVAGSFRNVELGVGRGRGRLKRERLIGIGMGRPYRLCRED